MFIQRGAHPTVTYALLIINVLVFFFSLAVGTRQVIFILGLIPAELIESGDVFSLFTSMFVHAGFLHILFNMYILYIFGRDVELILGKNRYLLLYFASGVVGGLTYAYYSYFLSPVPMSQYVPAVGASGAIFGVMAAFAVIFPNKPLALFLFLIPVVARAYVLIGLLALLQTVLAFLLPFSSVAYTAHIGGFVTGFILARIYKEGLMRRYYPFLQTE